MQKLDPLEKKGIRVGILLKMSTKPGSPWIHEKNRVDLFSLDQPHFWLSLCTACADGKLST